ncbi:hypothetical protein ACLJJ6_07050 [Pediococcus siamensis]|uniref:hypothetical protein n=1 Tax=Pediococcus siamensis TaxID=381829 RepID=UPI0039A1D25F
MTGHSKFTAILFFLFYLLLTYFVFVHQNMIAMFMMAIGMLLEATLNLWHQFRS